MSVPQIPSAEASDATALVRALERVGTLPDSQHGVQRLETHISDLFLTQRYVYKLKKRVDLGFLDFGTLAARKRDCEDEVRLNRRLAHDVYVGVVPVVGLGDGKYHIGAPEESASANVVDFLVQMRRLPAAAAMNQLIERRQFTADVQNRIAQRLAHFYADAAPLVVRPGDYRMALEARIRENQSVFDRSRDSAVRRLATAATAAQLRYLRLQAAIFDRRAQDGRIVEGHGDLRPEHLYLTQEVVAIDCVEFSLDFRTVDAADDLAFLAMECDRLRVAGFQARLFEVYTRATGDAPCRELVAFYKAFRACVRAKVALLRGAQVAARQSEPLLASAREYLELASQYAATFAPPLVVAVRGLSGTGKTTLAMVLAEALHAERLSTDDLRQRASSDDASGASDHDRYSPQRREAVYAMMMKEACHKLDDGLAVVLDATFPTQAILTRLGELTRSREIALFVVRCQCDASIAMRRIEERAEQGGSNSDATVAVYSRQMKDFETEPDGIATLVVDTAESIPDQLALIENEMRRRNLGSISCETQSKADLP